MSTPFFASFSLLSFSCLSCSSATISTLTSVCPSSTLRLHPLGGFLPPVEFAGGDPPKLCRGPVFEWLLDRQLLPSTQLHAHTRMELFAFPK